MNNYLFLAQICNTNNSLVNLSEVTLTNNTYKVKLSYSGTYPDEDEFNFYFGVSLFFTNFTMGSTTVRLYFNNYSISPSYTYIGNVTKLTFSISKFAFLAFKNNLYFDIYFNGPSSPTLRTHNYSDTSYRPDSYLTYKEKGDSFHESNATKRINLENFVNYNLNYALGEGFVSKNLFKNILPYDLYLVYSKGTMYPTLSFFETLNLSSFTIKTPLNRYISFSLALNSDEIYIDTEGSGLLLRDVGYAYRLYSPLSNAYKEYNYSGKLVKIVNEKGEEINITYSSTSSTTITDYRGNTITYSVSEVEATNITSTCYIELNNTIYYEVESVITRRRQRVIYIPTKKESTIKERISGNIYQSALLAFNLSSELLTSISSNNHYLSVSYSSSKISSLSNYTKDSNNNNLILDSLSFSYTPNSTIITNHKGIKIRHTFDQDKRIISEEELDSNDNVVTSFIHDYAFNHRGISDGKHNKLVLDSFTNCLILENYTTNVGYAQSSEPFPFNVDGNYATTGFKLLANKSYNISVRITCNNNYIYDKKHYLFCRLTLWYSPSESQDIDFRVRTDGTSLIASSTFHIIKNVPNITLRILILNYQYSYRFNVDEFKIEEATSYQNLAYIDSNKTYNITQTINSTYGTYGVLFNTSNLTSPVFIPDSYISMEDIKLNTLLKNKTIKYFYFNNKNNVFIGYSSFAVNFIGFNFDGDEIETNPISYSNNTSTSNFIYEEYKGDLVKKTYITSFYIPGLSEDFTYNHLVSYDNQTYSSYETYNDLNQPTVTSDEHNIISNYTYDSNHNLVSLAIGPTNSQVTTTYTYDSNNRLFTKTEPITSNISNVEEYHYKSTYDLLDYIKDPNNISLTYGYASTSTYNYVSSISKDNKSNSNTYSSNRLTSITSNTSPTFSYTYDDYNLLSSIKLNNNNLVTIVNTLNDTNNNNYDYQTVTYSNNYSYTLTKDKYNRLISLKEGSTDKIIYQYGYITSNNPLTYDTSNPYSDAKLLYTIDYYVNDTECYFYDSSNRVEQIKRYHSTDPINPTNLYFTKNIGYDSLNRITGFSFNINEGLDVYSTIIGYDSYKEEISSLQTFHFFNNVTYNLDETIYRDTLRRLSSISTDSDFITKFFEYYNNAYTLKKVSVKNSNNNTFYINDNISYDNKGNIVSYDETLTISNNDYENTHQYVYDNLNRLIEDHNYDGTTDLDIHYQYTYDENGNITQIRRKYNPNIPYFLCLEFTYDTNYKDKLVSITNNDNNQTISLTYDNFLNPTSIGDKTFTYTRGRLLESYKATPNTTTNYIYSYNKDGIRASKFKKNIISPSNIIPLEEHKYYYDNKKLIMEERVTYTSGTISSTDYLRYFYSSEGVKAFLYNNSLYYYLKDIFNNVIALLDTSNNVIARYSYDSYGNTLVLTPNGSIDTSPTSIGNINPFRYRSYYYDNELEMYYCLSRYYYPYIRRWLNGDDLNYLDKDTLGGINLYAYCLDNPVMYRDESGNDPWSDFWNSVCNWFENHWVELVVGASVILVGALTMGVGALCAGAGLTTAISTAGSALLNSTISTLIGATISATLSGTAEALGGGDFWNGFGDGFASGFMWGGIISGGSNFLCGAMTITRYFSSTFEGINIGSARVFSPNRLHPFTKTNNGGKNGGTIIKFGKLFRLDCEYALGLHYHIFKTEQHLIIHKFSLYCLEGIIGFIYEYFS